MSETGTGAQRAEDVAENVELADVVLDRLVPVVGEFIRADALYLEIDDSMLAALHVLGIVAPISVAALAGRCSLSHAATVRAVHRLADRDLVERIVDEGDGRSSWWVGRTAAGDETLARDRAGLREDLHRLAAGLPADDRLAVLRALPDIVDVLVRHALVRRERRWRETQFRRWQERRRRQA